MRIVGLFLAVALLAPAQTRSRKAHEHGSAKLNIAFESAKGTPKGVIEFEAPAESVVGFEHEAKSAADKAKQSAALTKLKTQIASMVIFAPASGCKIVAKSVEVKAEHHQEAKAGQKAEQHSEVHAEFDVTCAKPLNGTEVRFGFTKAFPGVHDVDVAFLAGEQQARVEVEGDKGVLRIAK